MTKKRRRRALDLSHAHLARIGHFFTHCALAYQLRGNRNALAARDAWGCMDSVARAAVIRLGLKPRLVALGCIPQD